MRTFPVTLAPAPRRVPPSLALLNLFNGFAQIGWFVFGFGMIFVWVFMGNADYSFLTFRGPFAEAAGRVVDVRQTGASENEQPIHANHYEFSVAGRPFSGTSYSRGGAAEKGQEVTVEYDEADPSRSRIAGMRRAQFGPFVSFVAIFALIGLIIVYFTTRSGLKRNHVLRHGLLAMGTLVNKERTNVTVNKQPVFRLTFEFTARDGRRCETNAHSTDTARLEDEREEPLLYDPDDPSRAYVLDEVPARPELEMNGELRGRLVPALLSLIIPGVVIAANLFGLWLKMKL